jgi:hypothetical protein
MLPCRLPLTHDFSVAAVATPLLPPLRRQRDGGAIHADYAAAADAMPLFSIR